MGAVYRALDRESGATIALKILSGGAAAQASRFLREARVLAELHHPSIVRYVAHGTAASGEAYLAMEWLEGEDLAARLVRGGRLPFRDCIRLAITLTEALAAAHERGVVHRDIKPSNVFLGNGDVGNAKLLDFGIARLETSMSLRYTRTGTALGTPGYMAPEQARGDRDIDARADIFSLGAVLFECATGVAAFAGEHVMAILAKILLDDVPRASEQAPDIPLALDVLLARMMAREAEERPKSALALREELLALDASPTPSLTPSAGVRRTLTTSEQRVTSIVLIGGLARTNEVHATTRIASAPEDDASASDGLTAKAAPTAAVRDVAAHYDGEVYALVGGALVVRIGGASDEEALRAARCALALREVVANAPMALATARGDVTAPMRAAIDRAARLVEVARDDPERGVRVDAVTAGLIEARFEIRRDSSAWVLAGERALASSTRVLLGRPTSCVGRTRELGVLEATWAECVEEQVARAVLVTAAPGVGKSRLRYELVRRISASTVDAKVWIARGDPTSAGSPLAMIAQAAKQGLSLSDAEPLGARHDVIRDRMARYRSHEDAARMAEFVGELVGVPFAHHASVQLRAARADPVLMGDQIRRAVEEWIACECEEAPLLLVLEDLHWGDLPSIRLVDALLRSQRERPLMVLALARPDIHSIFPRLWAEHALLDISLSTLTRKASESLVREALGEHAEPTMVARIVERADGNVFFLEELIRTVADSGSDELPETILAVMQERFARMPPESRRVLRAASVFGEYFTRGGLEALCGGDRTRQWLEQLVERELVTPRSSGRDPEYVFRHALVRDAAYAMLTDDDRATGHRLAAQWLENAGEQDADVLAAHLTRGGQPDLAMEKYLLAAMAAFKANDLDGALARCDAAAACLPGSSNAALSALRGAIHRWRGEFAESAEHARAAFEELPLGAVASFEAAADLVTASGKLGRRDRLIAVAERILETVAEPGALGKKAVALSEAAMQLYFAGDYTRADAMIAAVRVLEREDALQDPGVRAVCERSWAYQVYFQGDLGAALAGIHAAARSFQEAGDLRNACVQHAAMGYAAMALGLNEDAQRALRDALRAAERMALPSVAANAMQNLGMVLARLGAFREALEIEDRSIAAFEHQGDRRMAASSRVYRADILSMCARLPDAEQEARRALVASEASPPVRIHALATLARVLLLRGKTDEGRARAEEAAELLDSLSGIGEGETLVSVVLADARIESGDVAGARSVLEKGRAELEARAAKISDESQRRSFLRDVPENAWLLARAREVFAS